MTTIPYNMSEHARWVADNAEYTLRLNYDLNKDSTVIDVGGYKGEWSKNIYEKYNCNILLFEPVKCHFDIIEDLFKNNSKVNALNFALSDKTDFKDIYINADNSSLFNQKGHSEEIKVKDIKEFLDENKILNVDLIKINIEGSEYELLNRIIEIGAQKIMKNIQIQFHVFVENCVEKRNKIREELSKTHTCSYNYDFIWESWELNE